MKYFLLVVDLIFTGLITVKILNTKNSQKRGTNAFTRFVRDTGGNFSLRVYQRQAIIVTVLLCLIGWPFGAPWAGLSTIIPIVLSLKAMRDSTMNEQRVKDARTVTKGSLEVTGAVAETAGTVVGTVAGHGNPAISQAGKAIGGTVGKLSDKFADSMTDVQGTGITASDFDGVKQLAEDKTAKLAQFAVPDEQKFLEAAIRAGVAENGESAPQVAAKVYALMPENAKKELAELPPGQAAMNFLTGNMLKE